MRRSLVRSLFLMAIIAAAFGAAAAQGADNGSMFPKQDDKDAPMGFRDMMKKLEIERSKKDFEEMQDRGKQALEISNELEKSVESSEQFTETDKAKLETLEKLVKQIRRELGGSDEDPAEATDDAAVPDKKPSSISEAFKSLQSITVKLVDELQKTSRFTVSTAAIRSSNAVLRMTKFLRFWK